jgi:subtilisin family serine protease
LTFSTPDRVAAVRREIAAEMPQTAVQPDYYYITSGTVAETYNLGRIRRRLQPLRASGDGDGVRIAVIDTGVDLDLEDLSPNLVAHANYVENSTYRAEIHGTAVASIIAARRDHRGCAGIAPKSKLIALRACYQITPDRAPGRGSTSSLLQALDGALENRAAIINLSLGPPDRPAAGQGSGTNCGRRNHHFCSGRQRPEPEKTGLSRLGKIGGMCRRPG